MVPLCRPMYGVLSAWDLGVVLDDGARPALAPQSCGPSTQHAVEQSTEQSPREFAMPSAPDRRAEVDRRFAALEAHVGQVEETVGGLKRRLDEVQKACSVVVEGSPGLEALWVETAEVAAPDWRRLKAGSAEVFVKDLAAHVGLQFPFVQAGDGPLQAALTEILLCLGQPGVVRNVHGQWKWVEADQEKRRLHETFVLKLAFGHEALRVQAAMRVVEPALRRASGLPVDGVETAVAGQQPPRRVLAYVEKTATEKERAKGRAKGKGKGKDGEGKGKNLGKGKGKKGGKGKGGRGRGKGAAAAAAAAGPP